MNDKDRERLKTKIRNRISQLNQLLEHSTNLADKKQPLSDDEAANLDQTISAMVDSTLHANFRTEINLLTRNLRWLDSEGGGYCSVCAEPIAIERLLAVPHTRCCVDCASTPGI